jgi:hypothetical protein
MAANLSAGSATPAQQDAAAYAEAIKRSLADALQGLSDDEDVSDDVDDDDEGAAASADRCGRHHAATADQQKQQQQQYAPLPPVDELVAAVEAALSTEGPGEDDEEVAAAHACVRAALLSGGGGTAAAPAAAAASPGRPNLATPPTNTKQPRDFAAELDARRRAAELASVQDYVGESDSLVRLHARVQQCDALLEAAERSLQGFERRVGVCAGELRALQAQSAAMAGRLRGRREAEERLGKFVERLAVPEELVRGIIGGGGGGGGGMGVGAGGASTALSGAAAAAAALAAGGDPLAAAAAAAHVDEDLLEHLLELDAKLRFSQADEVAASSAARRDVDEVLARLKARAVSRVRDWLSAKISSLRRPRTNVSIIQQSVLLKFRFLPRFLQQHAPEVLRDLKNDYGAALAKVYCTRIKGYLAAMDRLTLSSPCAQCTDVMSGVVPAEAVAAAAAAAGGVGGVAGGGGAGGGGAAAMAAAADGAAAAAAAVAAGVGSAAGALAGGVMSLLGGGGGGGTAKAQMSATSSTPSSPSLLLLPEAPFVLGARANSLLEADRPAVVPHAAEALGLGPWPGEVAFRSVHRLLCDTATAEYVFCLDFWDDELVYRRAVDPAARLVEDDLKARVHGALVGGDALALLLMARLNASHRRLMARRRVASLLEGYLDRVDLMLWPRFRVVFDLQVASLRQAGVERAMFAAAAAAQAAAAAAQASGGGGAGAGASAASAAGRPLSSSSTTSSPSPAAHVHPAARRYAAFASALLALVAGGLAETDAAFSPPAALCGGDLRERLWGALFEALLRTSNLHPSRRSGIVFLVANYAHVLRALREADAGPPLLTAQAPTAAAAAAGGAATTGGGSAAPSPASSAVVASAAAAGMIGALGEAGAAAMRDVESQLASCTGLYVDDVLAAHFGALVEFSKRAGQAQRRAQQAAQAQAGGGGGGGEGGGGGDERGDAAAAAADAAPVLMLPGFGPAEAAPILRDFGARWAASIEAIHSETMRAFAGAGIGGGVAVALSPAALAAAVAAGGAGGGGGGSLGVASAPSAALVAVATAPGAADAAVAREVLQATLTQLLLHYTRALDVVKRQGAEGAALAREAVAVPTIMQRLRGLL